MIVITRNGQRTVISGWRAWLIALPVMLVVAIVIVAIALVALGAAVSIAAVLLFAMPLAIVFVVGMQLFQRRR